MIIEETGNCYAFDASVRSDISGCELFVMRYTDYAVSVDKQQAAQLVEVLQKWLAGEEVE